jgi:hypothetical protein
VTVVSNSETPTYRLNHVLNVGLRRNFDSALLGCPVCMKEDMARLEEFKGEEAQKILALFKNFDKSPSKQGLKSIVEAKNELSDTDSLKDVVSRMIDKLRTLPHTF